MYAIGKTSLGQLVHATDAAKHTPYSCLCCDQPFILRQGQRKRPHFAHKALTTNCTPETALHHGFKTLLFERIQHHIEQRSPLEFEWTCDKCHGSHRGNLIKKAASVALEHSLGSRTPDIALLNEAGNPVAVIEVVVTHEPEREALDYYAKTGIPVLVYALKSDDEMSRVDIAVLRPDKVTTCLNPKCRKCRTHQVKKRLQISEGKCWGCGRAVRTAGLCLPPGISMDLSASDLDIATQYGVVTTTDYSRRTSAKPLSVCQHCNRLVNHIFVRPKRQTIIDVGYYCPVCL